MDSKVVGMGSQYMAAFVDSKGQPLDGLWRERPGIRQWAVAAEARDAFGISLHPLDHEVDQLHALRLDIRFLLRHECDARPFDRASVPSLLLESSYNVGITNAAPRSRA
jgi:hypothetical protein